MDDNTADHFNTFRDFPAKNRGVIWGNITILIHIILPGRRP